MILNIYSKGERDTNKPTFKKSSKFSYKDSPIEI